jgi:hypothetical protein
MVMMTGDGLANQVGVVEVLVVARRKPRTGPHQTKQLNAVVVLGKGGLAMLTLPLQHQHNLNSRSRSSSRQVEACTY